MSDKIKTLKERFEKEMEQTRQQQQELHQQGLMLASRENQLIGALHVLESLAETSAVESADLLKVVENQGSSEVNGNGSKD